MADNEESISLSSRIWRSLLWLLVALIAVLQLLQFASLPSFIRSYGVLPLQLVTIQESGPLRYRVAAVQEPALSLGLAVGDIVRPLSFAPYESRREFVALFIREGESPRKFQVPYIARPAPVAVIAHDIVWPIVQCLELLLGAVLLRSRRAGRPALALATPLVLMAAPDLWFGVDPTALSLVLLANLIAIIYPIGVGFFAVFAYEFSRGQLHPGESRVLGFVAWSLPVAAGIALWLSTPLLAGVVIPVFFSGMPHALSWVVLWLFVFGVLTLGRRRSTGELRDRYVWISMAVLALLGVFLFWNIYAWWLGHWTYEGGLATALVSLAALTLLTVSLLKTRVLELRVVIGRTLVFSGISTALLAILALLRLATEKLLHLTGLANNVWLDAAVLLLVFTIAGHLHRRIERLVEALVFRPWHQAKKRLHEFERDAGYITDADVLRVRLLDAIHEFCKATTTPRLFTWNGSDGFEEWVASEQTGPCVDINASWLVALRATLAPVRAADAHPSLPGDIALPFLRSGQLSGFVILGPKPHQAPYRSDEIAAIVDCLARVMGSLEALHAAAAVRRVKELENELREIRR